MIVLPYKLSKSQSGTDRIKWVQRDADLMREGSIKQWEELESIRAIAERDAEWEMLNRIKKQRDGRSLD